MLSLSLDKAEGKPFNFALITEVTPITLIDIFLLLKARRRVTIENTVVDPERSTVKDQLLVVCETACQPLGNSLWEVAGLAELRLWMNGK